MKDLIKQLLRENINKLLKPVIPNKYLYHSSNPRFREEILKYGLIPKGKSETWLSDTKIDGKVIFATNSDNKKDWFDSQYDDDIYQINSSGLNNKWFEDPNFSNDDKIISYNGKTVTLPKGDNINKHVITFEAIPLKNIRIIQKGTGNSLEENLVDEDIDALPSKFGSPYYADQISSKLGYKLLRYLDSGNNGYAYTLEGGKVLKITSDVIEFNVASKLKGKTLNRISNVYETYKIKDLDAYIIILEELEVLTVDEIEEIDAAVHLTIDKRRELYPELSNQFDEIKQELINNGIPRPSDYAWWMNMGIKNGKLSVFDVGDHTIEYHDYETLDLSEL